MRELKKTDLSEFKETWTLCTQCAGCYYRGPIVPHNWRELPPPEWASPVHKCPSFEYFNFRAYTGLGRGNLALAFFDDADYPVTDDLVEIFYTCAACGMCSEICRMSQPLNAILAFREELVRRGGSRPEPVERMDANIEKSGNIFGAKKNPDILEEIPTRGENIYFAGCTARFQAPEVARATVEVLKAAGMDIACLGEKEMCCGFVAGHDGNTWLLEDQAVKNIEALKEAGARRVIVSCSHCYKSLKIDYPQIYGALPFEVLHVTELLAELIDEKELELKGLDYGQVTYHDPCFLGRHSRIFNEPRHVLKSIPGINLTEMERSRRWSYCCGSGAKITSSCYPELTAATTRERLLEAKKAADILVTACTTCYTHMNRGAKNEGIELKVYDLPLLVAESMGIL